MGDRIRELLKGRSQAELARAVRMDQSALSRVMSGQRALAVGELATIADYFGVRPEVIISEPDAVFGASLRTGVEDSVSQADFDEAIARCLTVIDDFELFRTAGR